VLPAALSSVLAGCRVGLVISPFVVFLAEMIASADGRGRLIYAAQSPQTVDIFVPHIATATLTLVRNASARRRAPSCWRCPLTD
jgi:NitT/TauT family transport system permease protein